MAKKKSHPLPEAAPAPTSSQSLSLALRRIDDEWDKKQTELSRTYGSACDAAWRKYVAALHNHTDNSFNEQYDDEREAALSAWKKNSEAADLQAECDRQNLFKRTPQLRGESDDGL